MQILNSSHDQTTVASQQQPDDDPIVHADDLSGSSDSPSLRTTHLAETDYLLSIESFALRFGLSNWTRTRDWGDCDFSFFRVAIEGT